LSIFFTGLAQWAVSGVTNRPSLRYFLQISWWLHYLKIVIWVLFMMPVWC